MQIYVVGFLFKLHRYGTDVALIEKLKPEFQRGKLNGLGGKVERYESPHEAMVREFREESGFLVPKWEGFADLKASESAHIYFFRATAPAQTVLRSMEAERVGWFDSVGRSWMHRALPNLSWLIPLALDPEKPYAIAENTL